MLREYRSPAYGRGVNSSEEQHGRRAARMHEATTIPTLTSDACREPDCCGAPRAESWFGEPFLHAGRGSAAGARSGHRAPCGARRRARRDRRRQYDAVALAGRCATGSCSGSSACSRTTRRTPRPGTELRRHQIDALAGMLAELIAANQRAAEENGNGNGAGTSSTPRSSSTRRTTTTTTPARRRGRRGGRAVAGHDPGAARRYRFRHPTASGKTIAAAGFVEAARHLGILILTHRRLLVSQFKRDLTTEGYGDRLHRRRSSTGEAAAARPDHDPDVRVVRAPRRRARPQRVPARHLRRGAHGSRREDERARSARSPSRSTSA